MEVDFVSVNSRPTCAEQNNNLVILVELTIFGSVGELTALQCGMNTGCKLCASQLHCFEEVQISPWTVSLRSFESRQKTGPNCHGKAVELTVQRYCK